MKTLFSLFVSFLFISTALSQNFHVDPDSTTLIKNTGQSPAHWYIEIYNDFNADTSLRWKCHFENIPAAWNISFDDQDNYHPTIHDGDSADFSFPQTGSFPQKLIIGASLNNTPGTGSVHVDLYDPDAPSDTITITYHFIITDAPLGLEEPGTEYPAVTSGGIRVPEDYLQGELEIFDITGKCVYRNTLTQTQTSFSFQPSVPYRIVLFRKDVNEALTFSVMITD